MGLNIAGIAINTSYKEDISSLEKILGATLLFEEEVPFEVACESYKEDTYCDIYFSGDSTFILCDMERAAFEFYAENHDVLSFVLSEMTMTFCINYVQNGKLVRTIMESEGELHQDEGTSLDIEKTEDDYSEVIYHFIEKTIGASFFDIDVDATCKRYTFQSLLQPVEKVQEVEKVPEVAKQSTPIENHTKSDAIKKPWWKFW